jgi:hypothetical protein
MAIKIRVKRQVFKPIKNPDSKRKKPVFQSLGTFASK